MLVNDELVRVLILLLLRSLKGKFGNNLEAIYVHDELKRADVKKKNLHQLEVFEAGQLLWDNAELVSIQIPGQRNTTISIKHILFLFHQMSLLCVGSLLQR